MFDREHKFKVILKKHDQPMDPSLLHTATISVDGHGIVANVEKKFQLHSTENRLVCRRNRQERIDTTILCCLMPKVLSYWLQKIDNIRIVNRNTEPNVGCNQKVRFLTKLLWAWSVKSSSDVHLGFP